MPLWQGNNPIAFGPASIKSLVAWYDVSSASTDVSDKVTVWKDKTSFENHLVRDTDDLNTNTFTSSNATIFNNQAIYRNSKLLEFQTPLSAITVFCVASVDATLAATTANLQDGYISNILSVFINTIHTQNPNDCNTNMTFGVIHLNTGLPIPLIYDNTFTGITNSALSPISDDLRAFKIWTGVTNRPFDDSMYLYLNGNSVQQGGVITPQSINSFNIFLGDSLNLTPSSTTPASNHNGVISYKEVIIYSTRLPESDISKIHLYLQEKYNLGPLANGGVFQY